MDILNFISWIRGLRVIDKAPTGSLVPIGVRDPRRDDRYISCAIPAENLGGGSDATTGKYRFSQFPDTVIPKTDFDQNIVGQVIDTLGYYPYRSATFFDSFVDVDAAITVSVNYCQSRLHNGIFIFEGYEVLANPVPIGYIDGWWVAYKQDPTNPERLVRVGQLKMTQQFWDNWYNWTAKDSGDNVVKFVTCNNPGTDNTTLESWITKLTWTGTALVAEDIYLDFGGATVLSLYNDLTGLAIISGIWDYKDPQYILDDDYYGMAMGKEAGWFWYRDVKNNNPWTLVGFNILTGATKWVDCAVEILNVTNFSPDVDYSNVFVSWYNHPDGITMSLDNKFVCDNGDNYNGVTALWSPYWNDPTLCIYIGIRSTNFSVGSRLCTNGILSGTFYWDNKAWYFFTENAPFAFADSIYVCNKYNVDTKQVTSYSIPYIVDIESVSTNPAIGTNYNLLNNNNGLFLLSYQAVSSQSFGVFVYQYLKHADSKVYSFHFDPGYPTHAYGDEIVDINTMASYNLDTLGISISSYKNMEF